MESILIIDDEKMILRLLDSFLKISGYNVTAAGDGFEGIEAFRNSKDIDLVITDIHMPRMDGNAVARYIRGSEKPKIPILAITGDDHEIETKDLFDSILLKPFRLNVLAELVKAHLD